MRRAAPITAFSKTADKTKNEVENWNKNLLPPRDTKTPSSKHKDKSRGLVSPPPDVGDMINTENGEVKAPRPPVPPVAKKSQYGDVVILPSGMAVRFKEEEPEELTKSGKRKRKHSSSVTTGSGATIEVFPSGLPPAGSRGRRKQSQTPASKVKVGKYPHDYNYQFKIYNRNFLR